jgi:DNA-binding winged helix-turn-helix (wHTH) protein
MLNGEVLRFGEFTLDVGERRLLRGAEPIKLAPKAYDVLVTLVRRQGRLVTKEELLARVWPEAFVEEGILTVHISALRKALGDGARDRGYIETVSGAGYRFVTEVAHGAAEDDKALRASSRPVELFELVGRGRSHLLSASYFELPNAAACFQAAIEMDPMYAPAHAGLAMTRCAQAGMRAVPQLEAYSEAKTSALKALAMESENADAQSALGIVLFLSEWDWSAAERSLRRALEINPDHTEGLVHYGSLMEALGKLEEGLRFKQQALARDPRSPFVLVQIAISYWNQRKYDDAIAWANKALDIDPRHLLAREFIAGAYWKQGDLKRLLAANIRQAEVFGVSGEELGRIKRVCAEMETTFATAGHKGLTAYMLKHIPAGEGATAAVQRAILHGTAGELDAAFENLDRALAARDIALVHLAVAPQWDGLRGDPRFNDRLRRMGLPS